MGGSQGGSSRDRPAHSLVPAPVPRERSTLSECSMVRGG